MRTAAWALLTALAASAATACTTGNVTPEVPSSASTSAYATAYPDALQASGKALVDDRAQSRALTSGLSARAADIKGNVDPNVLVAVVDRADESGRERSFADRRADVEAARRFWDEERGTVSGRVAAAAQSKLAENRCEGADVGGTIAYALKDGVDKQLEKRLRAANEAQVVIERYKTTIGPANVPAVQKLADDVALTSYLVNVALPEDKERVTRLLAEKSTVEKTLNRTIDEEKAFQQEKGRTDAEKKASEERVTTVTKSRDALGGSVVSAEVSARGVDDQIKQAKAEYDAALKALKDQLRQRH